MVEAEPVGRNIDGVPSLKDKTVFWETLAQDPFVLKTIGGYRLEFSEIPPLIYPTETIFHLPRSQQGVGELGEEITSLLRKGAIERVTAVTKGFFSSLFLVSKKGGGQKAYHKLEAPKSLHKKETLPNVNYKGCLPGHSSRRLVNHSRFEGRISSHPNSFRISPLSSIPVERKGVSILPSPIRLNIVPPSVYGQNKAIDGGMPSKGNTCHLLPRRHPGIGRLIQTSVSPQRRIVVTSPPSGLQEESNKMQTYPHSGFSLLGTRVGQQENESTPATRQDDSNSFSVQKDVAHKFSPRVRTDGPPGQDELCHKGCTIGTIELKTPTTVSTPRQWPVSEGSGQHHLRSKSLPALVDLASKEWTKYQSSLSRQCSSDRRFSERLGCTFRSQTSPRSLVSSSDEESYQLSRAPGGLPVPPALDIDDESPYHCATDRQHYGGGVLGEGGRYSIKSPVRTSSKDSQFCRGTSHQPTMPTNVLLARTVEHRSRHVVSPEGHLGVDVGTCNSKENFPTVRTTPDRPVCISEVETGVKVFHARSTRSQGIGHGCSSSELELQGSTVVRISPANANSSSIGRVHQFRVSVILVTPWWTRAPWIPELMSLSVSLPFCLPEGRSILDITYNTELSLPMVEWNISTAPSRRQGCRIKWPTSLALPGDQERGPSTRPCGTNGSRGVADRVWNLLPRLP